MGCKGKKADVDTRALIQTLFDVGNVTAAAIHRLHKCYHATYCGRLCTWLVKAPGLALVHCTHPDLAEPVLLYPALEDPAFACPLGQF